MTTLLDEIRAYVATIPTCVCHCCGERYIAEEIEACPSCGSGRYQFWIKQDTPADALLRRVAALEPVAYMHGDAIVRPMKSDSAFNWGKKVQFSIPLYTLTGDSHDR